MENQSRWSARRSGRPQWRCSDRLSGHGGRANRQSSSHPARLLPRPFWDFPPFRREIEAWSSFARLVRFDKGGTGLSDRPTDAATLEERTDDIRAVMDAVGLDSAVIYGRSEGGQVACMFAATYPERTTALVTWGTMARWIQAEGHPWGATREEFDELLDELETNWPSEYYIRGPRGSLGDTCGIEELTLEWIAD